MQQASPSWVYSLFTAIYRQNLKLLITLYNWQGKITSFDGVMYLLFHVINIEWIGTVITVWRYVIGVLETLDNLKR